MSKTSGPQAQPTENMGRVWLLPADADLCRAHSGARTVAMLAMRQPVSAASVDPARSAQPARDGGESVCGCMETWPQLQPGTISHGPGCLQLDDVLLALDAKAGQEWGQCDTHEGVRHARHETCKNWRAGALHEIGHPAALSDGDYCGCDHHQEMVRRGQMIRPAAPHAPSATPEPEKLGEVDREAQWRKRCKTVCGIARVLQFKEMADSMRLGAIMAVMKPEELADFNARIKANTKDIRTRLAALRAGPTTKVGED